MSTRPPTNWSEDVPGWDVVLIVEGEKFYVVKFTLARHSSYFNALFGNNFSESGKGELPIQDKSKEDFRLFLDFIHNVGVEFNKDTTWPLLDMGEYFNAPVVLSAGEEFLTSSENDFSLVESFVLADRFHLPIFMDWCKQQLTTTAHCEQVQNSDRWNEFGEETQRLVETERNRLQRSEQGINPIATQQQLQNPIPLNKTIELVVVDWSQNLDWTDCCIQVEKEKFFVAKATLIRHSKLFESIVSSDENPFVLKRQKSENFRLFLDYVHRFNNVKINEDTVMKLIETASRLKAQSVLTKAEDFVMKTERIDLCKKIELAHEFELPLLKARCEILIQHCSIEDIRSIMQSSNRSHWSPKMAELARTRDIKAFGEMQIERMRNMAQHFLHQNLLRNHQMQQHQNLLHNHQMQQMMLQQHNQLVQAFAHIAQVNQIPLNHLMLMNAPQFAPLAQQQQLPPPPAVPIPAPPQPILPALLPPQRAPPQPISQFVPAPNHNVMPMPAPPQPNPLIAPVPAPNPTAPPAGPQGPRAKRRRVNGATRP